MKISMKRIGALVLALVMVFGLLPVINNTAEAVDVSGTWNDSTIGLSYVMGVNPNTAITPWTASGNTLTGASAGKILGANYLASSNTLTITNLKSSTAKLSFDFELTGVFGSVTIDGTTYTEATTGSFSKELAANESIEIQLSAKKQLKSAGINTIGISITNLLLTVVGSGPVTTTFEAPAFGSYSVAYGDTTLDVAAGTASQSATNLPDVTYTLTANPGTGYKFVGWLDVTANKYLGIDATYVGGFESASTVKAIIVPESDPVFKTGDQYYSDLNEAVAYAQENALNQITLVQDGTLSAGSYTIPAGITLLIPKDTEYTVTGTDEMGIAPEYTTDVETPYAYRVLTMAEGAELIVNGVLDIEAKHTTYQGSPASRPYGGRVCGPYGAIYMSPNSSITVNNDAKLYAWGYVYGDGNVTANSGAEVYEIMQVTDFPGGSNMAAFVDSDPTYDFDGDGNPTNDYIKTFPFSQYYVQNIEVALTLHAGAAEYVYVSMTASSVSMGLPVQFIGESGMFNPADGTIVKDYDPSTDRLNVYVNGDASMAGITIDLTGTKFENTVKEFIGSSKVDSTTFILTLNSNISININSGITTVEQDLHLLPGVEISIAKDATLVIAQHNFAANTYDNVSVYGSGGYNVYVWDLENWGNYVFQNKKLVALNYSPTAGRIVRSTSDLKDVVIDVNGKVICEGYIYSTVTVDDEYTPVSGGGAIISSGKTGVIVMQNGCGVEDDAFCLNGSSNEDSSTAVDPAWLQNGDGSYLKTWCGECYFDVCPTCWGDRTTMLDCEDCGGTGMADKICSHVGQIFSYCENHDCWYTEGHKDSTVEVTWIINGIGGPEEYTICSIPSYKGSTPTKPANGCTSYTFTGWAATANGEVLTQLPIVEADVTYFAIFTESVVHMGDNNSDHKCDGCGNPESTCVDADNDHYCDHEGCKAQLSACEDANADHYCDYSGCQAEVSVCKDSNFDHLCDYAGCQATLSSCEDVNADHYCDYEGCQAQTSDCVDADADHYCDYVGCGEELSTCIDGDDKDHNCDYVGCQAENVDGGHHGGTAYCNTPKICAECGQEYGTTDANNHAYSDSTYYGDITASSHTVYYSCCGAVKVTEPHTYVSGICGCNAKQSFTVTWNVDGVSTEEVYEYGATPSFKGSTDKASDGCTTYTFTGWDKDFAPVTGPVTYTAQYQTGISHTGEVKYTNNGNGTHNGTYDCCGTAYVTNEAHTYVNGVCACCAVETITITWVVNGVTTTETYKYGETPSFKGNTDKAADGCTAYTFTGWDKDLAPVTGPVTYTAQYESGISHIGEVKYTNNGNGTHNGTYDCCGTAYVTNEAHTYVDGVCACGKLEHVCANNLTFHTSVTPNCQNGGNNAYYSCSCGKFYADANASTEIAENSWILGKDSSNHTGTVGYTNNGADHIAAYSCCGESWNENHTYVNGTCVCGALKVSKLTFVYGVSGEYKIELMVPYGTRLFDVVDFDVVTANMYVHSADRWGHYEQRGFYGYFDNSGNLGYLYYFGENYTMPDCDFYVEARYVYNGFIHDGVGWQYIRDEHLYKDVLIGVMMGDLYEGGSFEEFEGLYALDENGYRIENGLFRDYYIGEWINGVTYAPNAEDIAYYESKGMTFIDAEQTWYYFGADGKWAYNYTGRFGNSYIVNGHAAWHVGLVEIDGDYYYFKGDEVNGGNIMVTGDYYISRNNTEKDVVIGGLYTFGADGKLCWYNGITEVNGVLRYYEDGRLMMGKGLTQVGENFIYVNSYGELIVDAEYYIGANELGIKKGIYTFDANGFIVIPEEEPGKEGLHFEDGKWYYYVDGAKAYCAGLIQIDGNWVYVKSDGSLATGVYYVTNTNDHATIPSGTKCTFDNNGVLIDPVLGEQVLEEGGIRDEYEARTEVTLKSNGKLTIDVSNISMVTDDYYLGFDVEIYGANGRCYNEIVRGEGVVEVDLSAGEYVVYIYIAWFDGVDDDEPGYGRGSLDYKITFTSDGTPLNGIVDGYYYVDGHIAYAAGLIEIDGIYYYVRSNGQIVTDCQYWITNVNDTGYEPGLYEFDADGWMYEIYVETFTGIKDGYYYIDDEVAYAAGLVQYNGGYIYVRSNGQLATGKYWITNHNDLLPEGFYDFGENGVYYPAIPENAHLLMEVDKNVDTDGFWDSNAIANAVRASADGNLYIEVTDVTFEYELDGQGGFCIEFEGSYWVMQWDAVYKVGTGTVMIPVSADEDVILFVNPADVCEDYVDSVYGTISYKVWSDVECELVQGGIGE